jgi:hypothetical protein
MEEFSAIVLTTVATETEAEHLVACVQIEPIK